MSEPTARGRVLAGLAAVAAVALGAVLAMAVGGSPGPTVAPETAGTPSAPSVPSIAPTDPVTPPATPSEPSATPPEPPAGTVLVEIPEAGVLLPVPAGWVQVPAADLADPARRAELAARYPGSGTLLAETERLGDRAAPVFLAVDPEAAGRGDPLAANLSVLATQPSVGGPLLDLAAGFIADGMADSLGATSPPSRERVDIPAGDAVRVRLQVPSLDGVPIAAHAWVIGAPGATILVTLLGPEAVIEALDPDGFAAAIVPSPSVTP